MNWLDLLLGLVLVVSAVIGLKTGLVREVAQLAGVILGLIISSRTHQGFAEVLSQWLGEGFLVGVASFFIVFILVYVAALLLGWALSKSLKFLQLGWLDRFLGAFFGAARGVLLAILILIGLLMLLPDSRPNRTLRDSTVYQSLGPGVRFVAGLLPDSAREEIARRDSVHRGGERRQASERGEIQV